MHWAVQWLDWCSLNIGLTGFLVILIGSKTFGKIGLTNRHSLLGDLLASHSGCRSNGRVLRHLTLTHFIAVAAWDGSCRCCVPRWPCSRRSCCLWEAPLGQRQTRPRAYQWWFRQFGLHRPTGWRDKYCYRRSSFSLHPAFARIGRGQPVEAEGNSVVAATDRGFPGFHPLIQRLLPRRPFVCYCHIITSHLDDVDFVVDSRNCYVGFYPDCGRLCLILYRRLCFHLYLCCYICFPCDLRPSSRLGNSDSITLIAFLELGTTPCFGS